MINYTKETKRNLKKRKQVCVSTIENDNNPGEKKFHAVYLVVSATRHRLRHVTLFLVNYAFPQ